ncbi:hypothetical protein HKX48_004926 [Thoreauomyces humboldtii]|nr:hypothetical protein HKX48_004926 [Thoreauomyces humboldtii]
MDRLTDSSLWGSRLRPALRIGAGGDEGVGYATIYSQQTEEYLDTPSSRTRSKRDLRNCDIHDLGRTLDNPRRLRKAPYDKVSPARQLTPSKAPHVTIELDREQTPSSAETPGAFMAGLFDRIRIHGTPSGENPLADTAQSFVGRLTGFRRPGIHPSSSLDLATTKTCLSSPRLTPASRKPSSTRNLFVRDVPLSPVRPFILPLDVHVPRRGVQNDPDNPFQDVPEARTPPLQLAEAAEVAVTPEMQMAGTSSLVPAAPRKKPARQEYSGPTTPFPKLRSPPRTLRPPAGLPGCRCRRRTPSRQRVTGHACRVPMKAKHFFSLV